MRTGQAAPPAPPKGPNWLLQHRGILLRSMYPNPNGHDRLGRLERNLEHLSGVVQKLGDAQLVMYGHLDKLIGVIERLSAIEARTDERLESFITVTNEKIGALQESQSLTQENLNTLIKLVGKLLRKNTSA